MRADDLNSYIYPLRTEINGKQQIPTSHVYSKKESELKEFLVDDNLPQIYSTDEDESKRIIVDKPSTDEDKS